MTRSRPPFKTGLLECALARLPLSALGGAIVAAITAAPTMAVAQESTVRMEDAIQLALTNNERAQKTPLRVETAEGQLDRARTAFYPTIAANGSGTWRSIDDKAGRSLTYNSTVTLNQPLVTPSSFPLYSQAAHQRESEKWGAAQDRRVLAFDTARAFIQVLTSQRVLDAATDRLARAKANLHNAEARAQAQLASVNDATRATVDLATALRDAATAQGAAAKARTQLSFIVGKRIDGALAPPDRMTAAAEAFENAAQPQIQAAVDRRPDVRSAQERSEALRFSAKEPLYRLLPTLGAQAQLHWLPDPLSTEKATDETIALTLTWQIFDQGARYADRRTRLAQSESQNLDEKLLRRSVATDVELAVIALHTARDAYRIAGDAIAAATRLTEETEILYQQGLARALELTDANGKRFDAEVNRASAKLSMQQAYLDLRFALGLAPMDEDMR